MTPVLSNKVRIILNVPLRHYATQRNIYAIEITHLKHTTSVILSLSIAACSDGSDANTCLHHLILIRLCSNVIPIESLRGILVNLNFAMLSLTGLGKEYEVEQQRQTNNQTHQ